MSISSLRLSCVVCLFVCSLHSSPWIDNYRIRCVSRLWESLLWWLRLCFCVFLPFLILKPSLRGKESSLACLHVCKCVYALLSEREREQREPSLQCFLPWPSFWHHLHDDDPSLFLLLHLYFLSLSRTHTFSRVFCMFLTLLYCFPWTFDTRNERGKPAVVSRLFSGAAPAVMVTALCFFFLVSCKLIAFPYKKSIV